MQKKPFLRPIEWKNSEINIIDQTKLPSQFKIQKCRTIGSVWWAIKKLKVRGAPLIGIAGAYGYLLGIKRHLSKKPEVLYKESAKLVAYFSSSRPTAVNLYWALKRMDLCLRQEIRRNRSQVKLFSHLKREADAVLSEDMDMCYRMSGFGAHLIRSGQSFLTVCNAGALATSGYGTALGVFYRAHQLGKRFKVYVCETRPLLQGARLTTWELARQGIDVTLICDNMAADLMWRGRIKAVFVGSDRIAANGDFANKIGTYSLAVLAAYHSIPFYCVAPCSTFDFSLSSGSGIPIEERARHEITSLFFKKSIALENVGVFNPAFDVTPAKLTTAIITERGVLKKPLAQSIKVLYEDLRRKTQRVSVA